MKIKSILLSIWFLALFIAIPVILFLPPVFDKYKIELVSKGRNTNGSITYLKDLDGNGTVERIDSYQSAFAILSIQCFNENGGLIDQYNFPHNFYPNFKNVFFADADKDGLKEVYGFTLVEDSVYINWIEPLDKNPTFHTQFCAKIDTDKRKELDISIPEVHDFDFDGDGKTELVFSIVVGYNWFPRKLFVYHFDTNKIENSEEFGVHFSKMQAIDIGNDGTIELIAVGSSANNIPLDLEHKYHDDRSRIFVFNSDLKEYYKPFEFPKGIASRIRYHVLNDSTGDFLAVYNNFSNVNSGSFITKLNFNNPEFRGDTLHFNNRLGTDVFIFPKNEQTIYIYGNYGKIVKINTDLKLLDFIEKEELNNSSVLNYSDVNNDGEKEFMFLCEDEKTLLVFFEDFKFSYQFVFDEMLGHAKFIKSPNKNEFLIEGLKSTYEFKCIKNNFYFLKYPFFLIIYFLSVLFVFLIQLGRSRQIREKIEMQNQIRDLQLKTLKNQLDPHFIFNTFNTIASVIKQGRNEEAYDIMVQFSKMLRKNMDNSNKVYTLLKDEVGFVRDYLSIQKHRFSDLFEFEINITKDVNTSIEIPKMLLQIHVENALKHGIRPKLKNGLLKINLYNEGYKTIIVIEDNGIGRENSAKLNKGTTKIGLNAMDQIIEVNNKNTKHKIFQEIIDLKDENNQASGTQVKLTITEH